MEENNFEMMRFDLPKEHSSIIKVIGVGGGGSNAVNYMYEQGIKGVDFIVCNTDAQALDASPVPLKVQLGSTLTEGKGAGSIPEVGRNAAVENLDDIKELLGETTTMVFVTAGMGGGTGTGAAPVIAKAAKDLGILTVGIVTIPFVFEGRRRKDQATEGLEAMRNSVDTLLVIKNDKLRELYGNLSLNKAFGHADEVLCTAAKGIAEVITLTGEINVDMNDVNTVMRNSGVAIMGSGRANGEGRAMSAVTEALESPLLNDNDITGANFVLLNITYGAEEVLMDEIMEITDYIQDMAGQSAEVIWGYGPDESLESDLCVTVIATGFQSNQIDAGLPQEKPEVKKLWLNDEASREITNKVDSPTQNNIEKIEHIVAPEALEEPFLKKPASDEETTPVAEEVPTINVDSQVSPPPLNLSEIEIDQEGPSTIEEFAPNLFDAFDAKEIKEEEPTESIKFEEIKSNEEIVPPTPNEPAPVYYHLNDDDLEESGTIVDTATDAVKFTDQHSPKNNVEERPPREELLMRNKNREQQIREFTLKLKTPSGLSDLESEPAYKRKNVNLDDVAHSSESTVSRFTLSEDDSDGEEKKAQLRDNNSFLHDNVD